MQALLERSLASFKTPGLRDLGPGFSAPYIHNGQLDTLGDVIAFYIDASKKARDGRLRNPAPGLQGI
jgi:cytochrome c peroxidase